MDTNLVNEFPVASVETLGTPKKEVNTKPYVALVLCIVIAILLIAVSSTLRILGIIILALTFFAFLKIPNEKRLAFYDNCLIIYPHNYKDVCQKVDYDEIVEWVVRQGKVGGDQFILRLQGDVYIQTESFNSTKIVRFLNSMMPEREANRKQRDEIKNTPIKWPWKKK